jgi:ribA/ribD-fused uncharacterized protein
MRKTRKRRFARTTSVANDVVLFYDKIKYPSTYQLSPFFVCKFNLDDKWWTSVIQYYQANKYEVDSDLYNLIHECDSPEEAKRLGNSQEPTKQWVNNKFDIMKNATYAKFSQNKRCMGILINTGTKRITEMSLDQYWGGRNRGQNMMGHVLMEVRTELRKKLRME